RKTAMPARSSATPGSALSCLRRNSRSLFPCPCSESPPSRLLSLVGDEEQLGAFLGLELRGPVLAAEVVTDPQGVAVPLVDAQERLALVRAFDAGDVQFLRLSRRIQLEGALVEDLAAGHLILAVLDLEFVVVAPHVVEDLPAEFGHGRQPSAVN